MEMRKSLLLQQFFLLRRDVLHSVQQFLQQHLNDHFLLKLDSSGDQQWVKQLGTDDAITVNTYSQTYGVAISVDSSNDIVIGAITNDAFIGSNLGGFDLVVALSPASQRRALDLTRYYHLDVEYWPILDPTGLGSRREERLEAYRQSRDQILERIMAEFPPEA